MFYYLVKFIGTFFIFLFFRPKTIGRKNKKIDGKAIIMANHKSLWDPLYITVMFRRQIFWMKSNRYLRTSGSA